MFKKKIDPNTYFCENIDRIKDAVIKSEKEKIEKKGKKREVYGGSWMSLGERIERGLEDAI